MRYLWLLWFPLLFLPDLGLERHTLFGTLKISDFLIWPYFILVYPTSRDKGRLLVHRLTPLMILFVWWALLSTLLINFRYTYASNDQLIFGLLKLGKLSLYGLAGVLTIKALADKRMQSWFNWSLLIAGGLVGINLFVSRYVGSEWLSVSALSEMAYQDNTVSAMMAILICYLGGLWLGRHGSLTWRKASGLGLPAMTLGFFLARGRAGWMATMISYTYLLFQLRFRRAILVILIGVGLVVFSYTLFPTFKSEVDKTLWPDAEFLERYNIGIFGINDGARLLIWSVEGKKLLDAPILGRGFYHRSGQSGLAWTGSHNFFLQMFLETGLVGGLLVMLILLRIWRQASSDSARALGVEWPLKSALVAAFVVGMSGEYFYGGMVLFTLLAVYGAVGASRVANPAGYTIPSIVDHSGVPAMGFSTRVDRTVRKEGDRLV